MKLKRFFCLLLALICPMALAEMPQEAEPAAFTSQEAHAIVEALFAAAAGTTTQLETEAREGMSEEELAARNEQNALYRAQTLPWLKEALLEARLYCEYGDDAREMIALHRAELEAAARMQVETTPEPTQTAGEKQTSVAFDENATDTDLGLSETVENPAAETVWRLEDGFAAFAATQPGRDYLALLQEAEMWACLDKTVQAVRVWMAEVDHAMLREMNPDYRCWIYCPDTQIDYPVAQAEDNSKYLHRLFDGSYNYCGTLFVDYRNLPDFQDPNTLIYGHHMRDGSMFKAITFYNRQSYFEAHPYMLVMRENELYLLEIFAAYTTSKRDHCYDIAISDEADFIAFVDEALEKSDIAAAAQILPGSRLITLSTCTYSFRNARYIAIGCLSELWRRPLIP